MIQTFRLMLPVTLAFGLCACAAPRPVLYEPGGPSAAGAAAVEACHHEALNAGARPGGGQGEAMVRNTATGAAAGAATGAVGGAIAGSAARGAGIGAATGGTAGLIRSLFRQRPAEPAYRRYMERCLRDAGFDPVGWQ